MKERGKTSQCNAVFITKYKNDAGFKVCNPIIQWLSRSQATGWDPWSESRDKLNELFLVDKLIMRSHRVKYLFSLFVKWAFAAIRLPLISNQIKSPEAEKSTNPMWCQSSECSTGKATNMEWGDSKMWPDTDQSCAWGSQRGRWSWGCQGSPRWSRRPGLLGSLGWPGLMEETGGWEQPWTHHPIGRDRQEIMVSVVMRGGNGYNYC